MTAWKDLNLQDHRIERVEIHLHALFPADDCKEGLEPSGAEEGCAWAAGRVVGAETRRKGSFIRSNRFGENSRVGDLRHLTGCGMMARTILVSV